MAQLETRLREQGGKGNDLAATTQVSAESKGGRGERPRVVILTTSLLTDRILLHTSLLKVLEAGASTRLWAISNAAHGPTGWDSVSARVEPFPAVRPFKEFPYNVLRRLNEYAWDYRLRPPSRISIWEHVRRRSAYLYMHALRFPARVIASLRLQRVLEESLERLLLSYVRSPEAIARLVSDRPSLLVVTGPFQYHQPAVVAAAKKLGIPTLAFIPSWDNPSTKNRMVFRYDGYIVWSESEKRDLHHFFPHSRDVPVYVVGAPQFDSFFDDRFRLTRPEFCAREGLRPDLPVIVHALGSPNFLQEYHAAVFLAERVAQGDLGDVQLIVRPHPMHDDHRMQDVFRAFGPRVVVQESGDHPRDGIVQWVNTFRHADVVVNLASTVTIDAAIFDRPVINIDYDPAPGQPKQALVNEVNHRWTHFKPIAESGAVWNVADPEQLVRALRGYLGSPELHRSERAAIAKMVCGYLDGRSGERMAEAILDFASRVTG